MEVGAIILLCVPQRPTGDRNAPGGKPVLLQPWPSSFCFSPATYPRSLCGSKTWASKLPLSKFVPFVLEKTGNTRLWERRTARWKCGGHFYTREGPPQSASCHLGFLAVCQRVTMEVTKLLTPSVLAMNAVSFLVKTLEEF